MALPPTGSASAGGARGRANNMGLADARLDRRCMSRPAELNARHARERPARNSRTSRIQRAARI
jgi:hypothetical protein